MISPVIYTGLVLGAMSSLHCVGMCGPIALSLPTVSNTPLSKFTSAFLYNAGRVSMYMVLGAVVGMAGFGVSLLVAGRYLSIAIGLIMISLLLFPSLRVQSQAFSGGFFFHVRRSLGQFLQGKSYRSSLFSGIMNGLLPCGLVYFALGLSTATGSADKGMLFMAGFGLGNFPVMWALAFFGQAIRPVLSFRLKRLTPVLVCCAACLLIVRGLALGIPYLSPAIQTATAPAAIECHTVK